MKDDVLEVLDHAWERLHERMEGLTDDEWACCPSTVDPDISLRWRLQHIGDLLGESRSWTWLGVAPPASPGVIEADSATSAISAVTSAYGDFRSLVGDDATDLAVEIGPVAGPFASATRFSFVLHVADELIHHGAEAALLRDLYAGRRSPPDEPA